MKSSHLQDVLYRLTVHSLPLRVAISNGSHTLCSVGMTAAGLPPVEESLHDPVCIMSTIVTDYDPLKHECNDA